MTLDAVIAWIDAVRRRDRDALRAMLADDATWEGIHPEWRCPTPEAIVDHWLERAEALEAIDGLTLTADAIRLRAPDLGNLDRQLLGGVEIRLELAPDGRIARFTDHVPHDGAPTFVKNLADADWLTGPHGTWTPIVDLDKRFGQVGVNVARLEAGQPASLYHREGDQEGFLVLEGECLALADEQEHHLRRWDYLHCAPGTDHVLVGAGDHGCLVLLIGARADGGIVYPVSALAQRHDAGVRTETTSPKDAYAEIADDRPVAFDPGWLT